MFGFCWGAFELVVMLAFPPSGHGSGAYFSMSDLFSYLLWFPPLFSSAFITPSLSLRVLGDFVSYPASNLQILIICRFAVAFATVLRCGPPALGFLNMKFCSSTHVCLVL